MWQVEDRKKGLYMNNEKGSSMKWLLLAVFCINVLLISCPFGAFEVWLEKYKSGWGGEFTDPFWGKKHVFWICKLLHWDYVTTYHLLIFGPGMIVLLGLEWVGMHMLAGYGWTWRGWLYVNCYGVTIIPPLYFAAIFVANAVLEDFMWFFLNTTLNWHFPNALNMLLTGNVPWHHDFSPFFGTSIRIPTSYYYGIIGTLLILLIHQTFV